MNTARMFDSINQHYHRQIFTLLQFITGKLTIELEFISSYEIVQRNCRKTFFLIFAASLAPQSSINDLNSSIHHQRRCASTQPFPHSSSEHHTSNIHSSMRRHRIRSSNVSSPLTLKQQTSLNDHVFITEFGAI